MLVVVAVSVLSRVLARPAPALFPYTTLFRSPASRAGSEAPSARAAICVAQASAPRRPSAVRLEAPHASANRNASPRSEEQTSELQSQSNLVCRLLLEKKKYNTPPFTPHTRT